MENLPLILSILTVSLAIYYYVIKYQNVFRRHEIPHVPPKPIVGNMGPLLLRKFNTTEFLDQLYHLHPEAKYVGLYEFTKPIILLRDADLIKSICVKNFDAFQNHYPFLDKNLDPIFGNILFFTTGENWKNSKTMLTPMFTSSKIKSMFNLISDCAVSFADYISKLPETERELEFKTAITKYTNDVIANCVYGINVDSKKDPENPFYVYGKELNFAGLGNAVKLFLCRTTPWLVRALRLKWMRKEVCDFFRKLTLSTVKTRDEQGIYRPDFIQLLMETRNKREPGKELTAENIVVYTFTFFFGGFDSVSTQLSFILHHLAVNPEIQEKLQKEIDQVIENTQGEVTFDAITKMEYLDAVVHEAMRVNPLFAVLDRMCGKRFELPPALPGGKPFIIEPGMNLWIPIYSLHHDPNNFEDPEKFDPERFLVDGKRVMKSGMYLPFGIGPRACIGNRFALIKMKVLIFHLLARCTLKCCSKTSVPMELTEGLLTITSRHGFWMKADLRKDPHPLLQASVTNETCETLDE